MDTEEHSTPIPVKFVVYRLNYPLNKNYYENFKM